MELKVIDEIDDVVNRMVSLFGLEDKKSFGKEYRQRFVETEKAICEEYGVHDLGMLPPWHELSPGSEDLVRQLKSWITENYKFPKQ